MPYADPIAEKECIRRWVVANRERVREYQRRYKAKNLDTVRRKAREYYWSVGREQRIVKDMVQHAKRRAAAKAVPFSITAEDVSVPAVCPVFKIPLSRNAGRVCGSSPSLDCVVPAKGYVPGNVRVISHLANRLKSNATPDQLADICRYVEEHVRGH